MLALHAACISSPNGSLVERRRWLYLEMLPLLTPHFRSLLWPHFTQSDTPTFFDPSDDLARSPTHCFEPRRPSILRFVAGGPPPPHGGYGGGHPGHHPAHHGQPHHPVLPPPPGYHPHAAQQQQHNPYQPYPHAAGPAAPPSAPAGLSQVPKVPGVPGSTAGKATTANGKAKVRPPNAHPHRCCPLPPASVLAYAHPVLASIHM